MITLKNLKILSQVKPEFVGDVVIDDDRIVQVGGTAKAMARFTTCPSII